MATFTKVLSFPEALADKLHSLGADQLVVALTNTTPVTTWSVLTDLTEIAYTNLSARNITTTSSSSSAGTYTLALTDLVLTASGGSVAGFRYVYIYNDTAISDNLIGYIDFGSELVLADTETLTIDFNASTITLA